MSINLQELINDAGFPDVILADIPRNSHAAAGITQVAGRQFMSFKSPGYGESLLYSVVVAKQEDLNEDYRRICKTLADRILPILKESNFEADINTAFEFIGKMIDSPLDLTDEELLQATQADLATHLRELRASTQVKNNLSATRALNNALLVWFLNNRAAGDNADWSMATLYGMDEQSVLELKKFMYAQLNPKVDAAGEATGE